MGGHGSLASSLGDFCMSHCCRAIPRVIPGARRRRATTQPGHEGHQGGTRRRDGQEQPWELPVQDEGTLPYKEAIKTTGLRLCCSPSALPSVSSWLQPVRRSRTVGARRGWAMAEVLPPEGRGDISATLSAPVFYNFSIPTQNQGWARGREQFWALRGWLYPSGTEGMSLSPGRAACRH